MKSSCRASFAQRVITPVLPTMLDGNNLPDPCDDVHDDLYARILLVESDNSLVAIVALDLLLMDRPEMEWVKATVCRTHDLQPEQILVNFSHTHCGPKICRWYYMGEPNLRYVAFVAEQINAAIAEAKSKLQAVQVIAGCGQTNLPINRRRVGADGQASWGPDDNEPIRDALPFCAFTNESGSLVAMLFSVSCHPTIIKLCSISAEYPGAAIRQLNDHFQTDGAIFLQGAGGDTKPRNIVEAQHFRAGNWADMETAGKMVAQAVIDAWPSAAAIQEVCIKSAVCEIALPLEQPPTVEALQTIADAAETAPHRRAWAADMLALSHYQGGLLPEAPVLMHLIEFGHDLRLLGLEGELVAELGDMMAAQFDDGITFAMGYCNGSRLNIPADRQLPAGGYGVDSIWEYHWPAKLAPGVDQAIRDGIIAIRRRL